jgi:hypothetical protein
MERTDYDLVVALPGAIDDLEGRIAAAGYAVEQLIDDVLAVSGAGLAERVELAAFDQPGGFGMEGGRLTATDLAALSACRHALFVSAVLGDDARADAQATIAMIASIAPELIAIEDVGTWTWRSGRWAREIRDGRELAVDELFDIHASRVGDEMQLHTHGLGRIAGIEVAAIAEADGDILDEAQRLLAHVALAIAAGGVPDEGEPFAVAEDLAVRWDRQVEDEDDVEDIDEGHHPHVSAVVTPADTPVPPVAFDAVLVGGWFVPRAVDDLNGRQARRTLADARAAAALSGGQLLLFVREAGVIEDAADVDEATVIDWRLTLPSGLALGPFSAHDLGHLHDLEAGEAGVARVWTGLCEVTEVGDQDVLEGGEGAFVTAIALANSRDEFATAVTAALLEGGVLVLEIEDVESYAVDAAAAIETENPDFDAQVRAVAMDGGIELGPFHIWGDDEEE